MKRISISLFLVLLLASVGVACNIPVFRYALERWQPDACELIVLYDGDLSPDEEAAVVAWEQASDANAGHANARILRVDVAEGSGNEEYVEAWKQLRSATAVSLPHVLVRTKLGVGQVLNHWHGSLENATAVGLLASPARSELRRRLLAGHSVVWLLIASADSQRTAKARAMVQAEFEKLERSVQLPEGIGLPGSELYADVPLVLKFSVLEVDASDPSEQFLTSLLTEFRKSDFEDGEPLWVPVFGRGRALEVIPASQLSPRLMQELTTFLSGACSCQVKERNPGFDLLLDADWDGELFGSQENRPPDRSQQEGQNREPVLLEIPRGR